MPDPPDDDFYELCDEDAIGDDAPTGSAGGATNDTGDYELSEVTDNPVRGDLEIIMHPARYCRACGFDLTLIDVSPCPGCEKEFNPDDDSTTRDTPLPEQDNFWLQRPRLAGYGLLAMFIFGRPIIGFVGGNLGGRFADAVLAFAVLALIPWVFVAVLLAMEAVEEHHNPKMLVTIPLGVGFAFLLTLGLHPGVMVVAAIVGAFAGFFRAWRET